MWIKFSDRLVNFELATTMTKLDGEAGSSILVGFQDGGQSVREDFSTPRAAQDRFDALAGMLTGEAITIGVKK